MKTYLSITRIRLLTGSLIRDGSRVFHSTWEELLSHSPKAGRSIEQRDRDTSSPLHESMKAQGKAYFLKEGYTVFPRQVGLWRYRQTYRFADFAVGKTERVRLVECLTPWGVSPEKIKEKLQLDFVAPVDFICTGASIRTFQKFGYRVVGTFGRFERYHLNYLSRR